MIQRFSHSTETETNCNNQNWMWSFKKYWCLCSFNITNWMVVIEWKQAWWLAVLWRSWAQSRAEQSSCLWSWNPLWPSDVCSPHSLPLLTSSIKIPQHRKDGILRTQFPRPLHSCMFLRMLQTLRWIVTLFFVLLNVIILLNAQATQNTTPQKIEVSFFFKQEALRIASNASPPWLVCSSSSSSYSSSSPSHRNARVLALF